MVFLSNSQVGAGFRPALRREREMRGTGLQAADANGQNDGGDRCVGQEDDGRDDAGGVCRSTMLPSDLMLVDEV